MRQTVGGSPSPELTQAERLLRETISEKRTTTEFSTLMMCMPALYTVFRGDGGMAHRY